jgi:HlyD family secretion protein
MKSKSKLKKSLIIIAIIAVVIILIVVGFRVFLVPKAMATLQSKTTASTAKAEMKDIETVLSSSGTIAPIASYDVTTLVSGEIIAADFEEGDIVTEGQVLYQIATDTLDSNIDDAQTNLSRAKKDYEKAEKSYQDALEKYDEAQSDYKEAVSEYSDINVLSTDSGIVTKVYVEVGDTVQVGSQLADVYDNSTMVLTVPFGTAEVSSSMIGKMATVTIEDTFETIKGKVTKVSSVEKSLSGNRVVKDVTIEITNPGGITETTSASANIGNYYSMDSGIFTVKTNTTITSDLAGEISYLNLEENSKVNAGDVVLVISQDTVDKNLKPYLDAIDAAQSTVDNAKDALESRQEAIEDAESSLADSIDKRTDYNIKSPVTGKVITKNSLKGDTINGSSIGNSSLCTIYDLSAVTFDMNVDELDVLKVIEGQEVNITADALEGVKIKGVVTNISLSSTSNQGVTQYPVTVRINEVGNLLPGMNVTGEIVIDKAKGVLAIPCDALQRGDKVYVKDDTVKEAVGEVPIGYKAVQVTTGITDGDYIEVISGILEGDEVYVVRTGTGMGGIMQFNMQGPQGGDGGGERMQSDGDSYGDGGGNPSN